MPGSVHDPCFWPLTFCSPPPPPPPLDLQDMYERLGFVKEEAEVPDETVYEPEQPILVTVK